MVRGLYTGASGMNARLSQMDVVANNLANVNTPSYKEDLALFKAFPEMLLQRQDDDGVIKFPLGSIDKRPVVGRLGTGVEVNEVYTQFTQGNLQQTENAFDLALDGPGFFAIQTPEGERYTRNGSFTVDRSGILMTKDGFPVLGENGVLHVKHNNLVISERGEVVVNQRFQEPPGRPVQMSENAFDQGEKIDRLKIVQFPRERYLQKVGSSLYRDTEPTGGPQAAAGEKAPKVQQGFLESSNVNVVREMVHMIEVQRSYEASQKAVTTHDGALDKLINQMAVVG
ncbi:MAG: flagellar basal-body rod protein FlgF [Spirochaetes bacterium]|nr:flagellar basal-body rod protein FlgF [Spirochaetota bacterium]